MSLLIYSFSYKIMSLVILLDFLHMYFDEVDRHALDFFYRRDSKIMLICLREGGGGG